MGRRPEVMILGFLAGCSQPPNPDPAPSGPPNVLLFTLDTLRADALQIYGNKVAPTPVLSQLAEEGTRFSRAFTVTPLTIPAHSSMFTGLYPPRHGVRDNGDLFLSEAADTLAERLKRAGYATMASVGAEVTSHHWGFAQGFDAFFDDMGTAPGEVQNRWRVERRGDAVVDDALGWLNTHMGEEQPFFAWIHMYDAHHPYAPPEPFASMVPDFPYLGEVAYLDSQVGRVIAALARTHHLDDTLIIVVGDHGEGLGSHGESMHGVLLYNATTRIPMLVRPPGGQKHPGFVHFPVSLVDLLPTVLAFAGQPAPEGLDGLSVAPWVGEAGPAPLADRAVYTESLYPWRHYGWAPQRAITTDTDRLIDSTTPELYGRDDLAEVADLAAVQPGRVGALQAQIAAMAEAMTPMQGVAGEADRSAERLAQLEALGYVTGVAAETSGDGFGAGLPDPVARLPSLAEMERARAALQADQAEEAEAAARALVAREPGLLEARTLLANALARQGELEEAIALMRAVEAEVPSSGARVMLGNMHLELGDLPEALRLFDDALRLDPYLASAVASRLRALFLAGDLDALERALQEARATLPDLAEITAYEGLLLQLRGEDAAAEPLLRAALAREPGQPLLRHALGLIARKRGQDDEAETLLLDEVALNPPALGSRRVLVEIYAGQKRYDEQLAQLEVLSRLGPPDLLTIQSVAQARYNLARYPEALEAVDAALTLSPRYPAAMMLKANVLKRLGRAEEAEQAYHAALKLAGQEPKAGAGD